MAYNKSIPQPTDTIAQSQTDFLANFTAISDFIDVNHVSFNDSDQGKHIYVTLPEQSAGPTTQANEGAIYTKVSPSLATTALFFRNESSGDEIELTGATKSSPGWAYLPSGIILMWGHGTVSQESSAKATFITGSGIPTLSNIHSVQVSIQGQSGDNGALYYESATLTDITVYNTATAGGSRAFTYLVIGD